MNNLPRRVVITGSGVVSALGKSAGELFENLLAGRSAVKFMSQWQEKVPAAPISDFVLPEKLNRRNLVRSMGKVSQYCAAAALSAMENAGWERFPENGRSVCVIGSTFGSSEVLEDTFKTLLQGRGMNDVSPMNFFKTVSHSAACNTANALGLDGAVYAPAAACASGLQSIGLAATLIACGEADYAIAGGGDELNHLVTESFILMDAHAFCSRENAASYPRPFDRNRNGLVCGEGAAVVVLEEYEAAKKRGANIIAEINAYASNRGRDTVTQSDREAVKKCLSMLLAKSPAVVSENCVVNAHATGTLQGDRAEAEALYDVFGSRLPVSSFKGNLGHTLGAAGAVELVAALEMMQRNILLPTVNLSEPGEGCEPLALVRQVREKKCDMLLKNSFAFGGINAVMLCSKI